MFGYPATSWEAYKMGTSKGGRGAPFFFGMGASKNTVWGMAAYILRGMEDGNFSRFKCISKRVIDESPWPLCNQ